MKQCQKRWPTDLSASLMSFRYWVNEARRGGLQICLHPSCTWVLGSRLGTHLLPRTEKLIGPDASLPRLFNVSLGSYRFHWCCFVLKKQIILTMCCTSLPRRGQSKVVTVVDNTLRNLTSSIEFRRMVFYLCRWFTAQYVSPQDRWLCVRL
jgi:hypothetical protein